jgi:hypothetical protein
MRRLAVLITACFALLGGLVLLGAPAGASTSGLADASTGAAVGTAVVGLGLIVAGALVALVSALVLRRHPA